MINKQTNMYQSDVLSLDAHNPITHFGLFGFDNCHIRFCIVMLVFICLYIGAQNNTRCQYLEQE